MVDLEKILRSLPSGVYEWDADTLTFSEVIFEAEIVMRKSVFCIPDVPNKHSYAVQSTHPAEAEIVITHNDSTQNLVADVKRDLEKITDIKEVPLYRSKT